MTRVALAKQIESEGTFSFSRAGGPGGQNVNKVNSRVTLRVPLSDLGLSEEELDRVRERLGGRISTLGELIVHSAETRSQGQNRERALARALAVIDGARTPVRKRTATRPGRMARERRLQAKKKHSQRKRERRRPSREE